ncbi:eukaryotic translation initiation factor 3 subunit-like protein [Parachaetomium inaequale]|uniref:Eukaryotic translation initiation factor 3 subunit H n=1 Tax=Parachaetomium inaequale TaxID=2588326 RepID=A0AAN6PGF4_9PEZI|nr:eukaryotic translation initiation factor 3 subunit-like protein [Parachaetomium inaequale]
MTIPQGPVVVAEVQAQQPFRNLDAKGPTFVSEIKAPVVAETPSLDRYLVVSPYHEQDHLLDLESLDVENQLLALSLTKLKCLRQDYATAPYTETFNWGEIIETLQTLAGGINHTWKKTSFFVVAFRSRIPPTTVYAELGTLDKAAHAEATASGGFLKYWFGTPDAEGRNLATCIWRSQEDARKGGTGPAHRKAAGAARSLYSFWKIDRLKLTIEDVLRNQLSDAMVDAQKDVPFKSAQVESLVVMKIVKHCSSSFPTAATGSLVGMDSNGVLEITNAFPFPTVDASGADGHQSDASSLAAAAPRAKANIAYQNEMIRHLKEVNVDANNVGWYTSATMGNFINLSFIENQYHYQRDNDQTVALVHDVSRSSQGALSLRAFRLSPEFMAAFKEGKFTTEILQKSKLTFRDIIVEVPVIVHNSHLLTSFLHQIPAPPASAEIPLPTSLDDIRRGPAQLPAHPSFDTLDLSIDPFLEKTCDLLLDSIESHYSDLNNHQYYQRQLTREQFKITQWQTKRKAENAARLAAKQQPLPEDEWQRLFKLPQEPSRLEGMLNARQVEQYSKQVDGFTATITSKMFAVRGNLLPE